MELSRVGSHEGGESVLFEKDLGEIYAEAREITLGTRGKLTPDRAENNLRIIRERILRGLTGCGWKIGPRIFPFSAPAMFQRGHYRLDASKTTGSGAALGIIFHFGGSEFLIRQFMLISEAVRRGIADCAILALITRDFKARVTGRPSCYEQARRLLRAYGQSAFPGVPMVLWGLTPDSVPSELADARAGLRAGD